MPMGYYVGERNKTTNATGNTETVRNQFITGTSKPTVSISAVLANCVMNVAGGGVFTASIFGTAGSVGSGGAVVPSKKNPNNAAAGVTFNTNTAGALTGGTGTRSTAITCGFAQTGGQGGWYSIMPDMAVQLVAGGGANGYLEFADLSNAASQLFQYQIEWYEN